MMNKPQNDPAVGCPLERRVRAPGEHFEVRYTTYNNFRSSAFAPTREDAQRIVDGLQKLKHVSGASIIECSNMEVSGRPHLDTIKEK